MRVMPGDVIELDDLTVWVRVGRRMFQVDDEAMEGVTPLLEPITPVVEEVVAVPPLEPAAPKAPRPAKEKVPRKVKVEGPANPEAKGKDVALFRKRLCQGVKPGEAARAAGLSSSLASYYSKKWKAEGSLVMEIPEEAPLNVTRRCPNCSQRTATDPCLHCGERIAPLKGGR